MGQWPSIARVFLESIGHPLRPINDDLDGFSAFIEPVIQSIVRPKALILGVTPELYHLLQPNCHVSCMDHTADMIRFVWPGSGEQVFQSNWLDLESIDELFDLILIDGGLHLLSFHEQQSALVTAITSKLRPGGRFVTRLFTPPHRRETTKNVWRAAHDGSIPSVNHLKIRLLSALQISAESGVELHNVWREIEANRELVNSLEGMPGWSEREITALEAYRDRRAKYSLIFPDQLVTLMEKAGSDLKLEGLYKPDYLLGDQFPILCFSKGC